MKYIRTKNGIYNRSKIICCAFAREYQSEDWNKDIEAYLQTPILKQADTIEELCDGLIVEQKDNTPNYFIMDTNEFIDLDKEERLYRLKDWNFNTFIKIDKGLIYVAKMNDKGELELL